MSLYVKVTNNVPEWYGIGQLTRDNPDVSFPGDFPDSVINSYNVFRVVEQPEPVTSSTEVAERDALPTLNQGQWEWGWTVRQKNSEEVERELNAGFNQERNTAKPTGYSELDLEVLYILRQELQHFDNGGQANTPLCNIVASILEVDINSVRNAVRNRGNNFYTNLVTSWANKRKLSGGV